MLEGELIFQVDEELATKGRGRAVLPPRKVVHTLANHSETPARYVLVCTPAGFERHWARLAAEQAGVEPPQLRCSRSPRSGSSGPPIAAQE
jgi:hypothetical protein